MASTVGGSWSFSALAAVLLLAASQLKLGSCECEFCSLFVSCQLVCRCGCVRIWRVRVRVRVFSPCGRFMP